MDVRLLALLLALALGLIVWAASIVYRSSLARSTQPDGLAGDGLPVGDRPVVLAFTGDYCLPCKTQQHPALEQLRDQIGDVLDIQEVDALERADLAQRYGVLTVPTTVVLDRARHVIAINYGVTSADKLARQLKPLLTAA